MRRRQFFALGLGMAGLGMAAAACGADKGTTAGAVRLPFAIAPGAERWAGVTRALTRAAWQSGFMLAGHRQATTITVTGLPALAAAEIDAGPRLLETATPLARLAGEIEVVVVPAASPFRDFEDFGAQLLARPEETPLAGGPQGEPDHLLFGLVARGLGADARRIAYTGHPTTAEATDALRGGRAVAAAGPLRAWRADLRKGRVRALAVSSARRVDGLDVPSLLESGVRIDFADWCAAVGPQDMAEDLRATAVEMCERVAGSAPWHKACRAGGWQPIPLSGGDFEQWLASETARTRAVLRDLGLVDTPGTT
ncbi:tripartite tricarboxylate transporter substrate-binding protein [Nonomuraea muscovyensis]|uniref:Putative tricarboxylic transport membrane protein n=1 Tax=Nonomuraea muscovyensis TaxID=1124761 RepID=A0A7X0C5A0_9ACTN|nr:tripartite tricarboxylate transporter substrate-binding protein [Nonomuraea muscovyensis]MBB6348792.1 putative tricarboxylic transport membrane protein [Nonomuraea muscovyensis]